MRRRKQRGTETNLITEYTGTSVQIENEELELMSEEALQEDSQDSQVSKETRK